MLDYELIFVVEPPGLFGLPESGKIVYPEGEGEVSFEVVDPLTGNVVKYGTMPKYRAVPLEKDVKVAEVTVRVRDNFLYLNLKAPKEYLAIVRGMEIVNWLCTYLSVEKGTYFNARLVQAVNINKHTQVTVSKPLQKLPVRYYDLERLEKQIDVAGEACSFLDTALEKASAYFYHALFLTEEYGQAVNPMSYHARLLIYEIISNCARAVEAIFEDRGTGGNSGGQKFCPDEGLLEGFKRLKELVEEYDFDRFASSEERMIFESSLEHQDFARNLAQEAIRSYIRWLRESRQP